MSQVGGAEVDTKKESNRDRTAEKPQEKIKTRTQQNVKKAFSSN